MQDNRLYITIAPGGSHRTADYVCSGRNDEIVIGQAIEACSKLGRRLMLYTGCYYIDGFRDFGDGGPLAAISIPRNGTEVRIEGETFSYNNKSGVRLYVSEKALNAVAEEQVDVIRTEWCDRGIGSGSTIRIENISIGLSNNRHPVRCIDLRRCDRPELKNVRLLSYVDMGAGLGNPPPIAHHGCIGLTMTDGSNNSFSSYENVSASGFYEGIQVGGEHVVLNNCAAIMNFYGFTFGNYETHCGSNHPILLLNCCDERNVNLPLFGDCGDDDGEGGRLHGGQEVTMIAFNIERVVIQTPGGVLGDCMREAVPGSFCGRIEFTAQPAWCHTNEVAFRLWEEDGSGRGFRTQNMRHRTTCSTEERLSYYPSLGQEVFDTDLGYKLICIDPANKKWVRV